MGERLGASGGGPYISRSNAKLSLLKTKEKEEYIDFKLYINYIYRVSVYRTRIHVIVRNINI